LSADGVGAKDDCTMDFDVDRRYDITHFVLAGLYFLLCLLSIFCMLRLCVVGHFKRWQLFFHPIFFLGTLGALFRPFAEFKNRSL
jgi:hypothetical protein